MTKMKWNFIAIYMYVKAHFFCLQQAAKEVSQALNNCVNFLPGQRDVDEAIKAVVDSSQSLAVEDVSALFASQVTHNCRHAAIPFMKQCSNDCQK